MSDFSTLIFLFSVCFRIPDAFCLLVQRNQDISRASPIGLKLLKSFVAALIVLVGGRGKEGVLLFLFASSLSIRLFSFSFRLSFSFGGGLPSRDVGDDAVCAADSIRKAHAAMYMG